MSKKVNTYKVPESLSQEKRLKQTLKLLKLEGMLSALEEINSRMRTSNATYYDFLESLLEKDMLTKEANRIQRWLQKAHFPLDKTLKDFNFAFQPSIHEQQIKEFASCRFIEKGENIAFFGQTGVGKTHLAAALGRRAVEAGFDVRFLTLRAMQDMVEASINGGKDIHVLLTELSRPRLLILDEMDLYDPTPNLSIVLSKLLSDRHEKGSVIFTANQNFGAWSKFFGTSIRAETILDRIIGNSTIVEINGPSYRNKDKLEPELI